MCSEHRNSKGSGKSYLGVMDMLKYVHVPTFRGVMVRRTTTQLKGPGGLFDTANTMYRDVCDKLKINTKDMKFKFPSGAEITLNHCQLEQDRHNFQGWQVHNFLVDEAQQFLESQVIYFWGRCRDGAGGVKPQMKMTCNPEYHSFLRKWLSDAGYLDLNNYGIPDPEMDGVTMWFVRQGNDMIWRRDKQDLIDMFGEDSEPTSFCFYSATCRDNPVLLKNDSGYLSRLKALPRVERMRLLEGAWLVQEESAGLFKRDWVSTISELQIPDDLVRFVRSYDLAGSLPSEKYPNPDYSVGLLGAKGSDGHIYILDMTRFRERPAKVLSNIIETGLNDGEDVTITIPEDPGAHGKRACESMMGEIQKEGLKVKRKKVSNVKNRKGKAFEQVSVIAENGQISVVKADWNEAFFEELERFEGTAKSPGHDDIVDAFSDLVEELIKGRVIPSFTMPSINAPTKKALSGI